MEAEKIFKKLRFDKAANALIVNAPKEYAAILQESNYDCKPVKEKEGSYDFVQIFATAQAELERLAKEVEKSGKHDCIFWACYPKGTGNIKSDIKTRNGMDSI